MENVSISPAFRGVFIPKDLLNNECTVQLTITVNNHSDEGIFFEIHGDNYFLSSGIKNDTLFLVRNNYQCQISLREMIERRDQIFLVIMWSVNKITLYAGSKYRNNLIKSETHTAFTSVPQSLILWARKQNLIPINVYRSEEEFRQKIFSCLATIQDKITESMNYNSFWDITYEGKKILSRHPKNETDIHPLIQCILSDQMLMSGVSVVPEAKTGIGNLDFLFCAPVENKGIVNLCVEFKNAHSKDIFDGLLIQLPRYMDMKHTLHGAYCVLYYKGEWFDEPKMEDHTLITELFKRRELSSNPFTKEVRVFMYNLSRPISASKIHSEIL